ncbi:DNA-binding response OmpR family regulator [Amaricoccus macauensis]|uniref:DNA-binding response OmpR family regulator n=1 Tax=Amaricoccus macauensis TaxID=57001 RepID=A0A840STU5_9RHOB|nr:response regulator transcription factor [Amaricoccus macauensis]MBB5224180.1 DNA-binding response OmpR family regulator [Amaricoccus macauensis]
MQGRILVVDDDRRLCGFLARFLAGEGFAPTQAHDGAAMRRALADLPYDLVLLDLGFPRGDDGLALARALRSQYDAALIVVTGKTSTIDKVVCLELGADDYVTKPFQPRELLARIRAVLRRVTRSAVVPETEADTIRVDGWRVDLAHREVYAPCGVAAGLTSKEFDIVAALARRPGRVLSRDQLLDLVANRAWTPSDRSVDVLVGKVRRKIGDEGPNHRIIRTVRGIGYVFAPESVARG